MDGPVHLHPTAEVAPRALLPGDPGRALHLAQALLEEPRMSNHHRGLWGYTGRAADGQALTIQSTGMGGPSAAIVVEELAMLGVRRAIRVGTCGALVDDLELGELVVAREVLAADGASRALGAEERLSADPALAAALEGDRAGLVASVDLFYDPDPPERWARRGALAVEMELAAVLAVARRRGIAAAGLLAVSDLLAGGRRQRIERGALTAAEERLGRVALAALA
jgi:uridine phosphorylase